jgi:hypothetical protein
MRFVISHASRRVAGQNSGATSPEPIEINPKEATTWKQRILRELIRYWINFAYLAIFFGVFAWYRNLILAEFRDGYFNYGAAIIEALILAKIIWLGELLRLGRGFENRPLIYPTLYKAVAFACLVGVFAMLENIVRGVVHGKGVAGHLHTLWSEGKYELLARCMVTFLAFIPFFAFRELEEVLGKGRLRGLFFRRKTAA